MLKISTERGDGRTTQQLCFALGMASAGKRVIWVARNVDMARHHCRTAGDLIVQEALPIRSADRIGFHGGGEIRFVPKSDPACLGGSHRGFDFMIWDHDAVAPDFLVTKMQIL